MKNIKEIEMILPPPPPNMVGNGFKVHSFFPSTYKIGMRRMSPFFLMDYNAKRTVPPSQTPRGVDVHPHRGFETVTIAYHGKIAHHDNAGNSGVIEGGGVQWMTAGAGVLHKEYYEKEFNAKGGEFQMIQLWVNLPAKYKMTSPKYQGIKHSEMGKYFVPHEAGVMNIIAGEYEGVKGAASTFSPVELYDLHLANNINFQLSIPTNYNTGILVVEGKIKINDTTVQQDNFVIFKNEGTEIDLKTTEKTKLLVLSGEPIDEPLVQYGPFLMNTQEEIMQAIQDFETGKFGEIL